MSIAIMNNMGERESPWRTPLRCAIGGSCCPFRMILDDGVLISVVMQWRQVAPKPHAYSLLRRNDQERVSNALEISSLSSSMDTLFS
jgi:hypothetical protein